ncbi:MAG: ATP-binding cassette domain-containing protein, partial [Symploca sp. SIO2G7]|nr:ATP-binding cassette domain-containing protein [Symploca sp. SIO2G7]
SGGQQQRVALARVLVQNPEAILADEPISNLDRQLSREIMDLLKEMSETGGKTLVTSLHSLEFACSHCDRLVGLQRGQIIFDVPTVALSQTMIDELFFLESSEERRGDTGTRGRGE